MTESVFENYKKKAWPFRWRGQIVVDILAGGVPTNPKVAEGWIKSKLDTSDNIIREMVAETMIARGVDPESGELDREAVIEQVASLKSLNGFKRDVDRADKGLYIEGRQLKAALKEAVSVAVAAGRLRQKDWGSTRKWITKYFPEHVFVEEDKLHIKDEKGKVIRPEQLIPGAEHPRGGINQRFVTTMRNQRAIQYEEFVENAYLDFTIVTDHDFEEEEWAQIWLTGEMNGVGAARSAGFGRYTVTKWGKARAPRKRS